MEASKSPCRARRASLGRFRECRHRGFRAHVAGLSANAALGRLEGLVVQGIEVVCFFKFSYFLCLERLTVPVWRSYTAAIDGVAADLR
ncbi:hypothetical protein, partial [Rhodoblastus sphagnicola]